MRELNAAWAVLRSPAARAAYDEQLRGQSGATGSGVNGPAPTSDRPAPRSFDGQLVDPRSIDPRTGGSGGARPGRWLPITIVVVLVLAGLVVAALSVARRSSHVDEPVVVTNRYPIGSCVAVAPGASGPLVGVVSCDGPNSGQVAATTDYPRPCPAGTETVSLVAEQLSVCLSAP